MKNVPEFTQIAGVQGLIWSVSDPTGAGVVYNYHGAHFVTKMTGDNSNSNLGEYMANSFDKNNVAIFAVSQTS